MSKQYKQVVAKLKLTDVMPELAHDTEVCRLDAERERLANEYLAADGALLRQIAHHIKDGSGRWSRYIKARTLPGNATPLDRIQISNGLHVDVARFDRSAVHDFTHCPDCGLLTPECICHHESQP